MGEGEFGAGIFISTDGGQSWKNIFIDLLSFNFTFI